MPEGVLSIDTTVDPARVVVAVVDGRSIQVVEEHRLPLVELLSARSVAPTAEQILAQEANPDGALPVQAQPTAPEIQSGSPALKELLTRVKTPWHNSILVLPGDNYISLNLALPFGTNREINKILELEVQDVVPFDVKDFVISHSVIAPSRDSGFDIHVGLISKSAMSGLLSLCQESGVEPMVVSTAPNILAGVFEVAPTYFAKNCALLWAIRPNCVLTLCADGKPRSGRVINTALQGLGSTGQWPSSGTLQQIRLTLAAFERERGVTLDKIYLFGNDIRAQQLQAMLGRDVEEIKISELVKDELAENSLASLATIFGAEEKAPVLANFRTGDFAFRPQLRGLFKALRSLLPYAAAVFSSGLIALVAMYFLRQSKLETLQNSIRSQILAVAPSASITPGSESASLQTQIHEIEDRLKELGSLSRLNPLDAFLEISKDLPNTPELSIFNLIIKENKITIKGNARNYPVTIDKLDQALKSKRQTYCSVEIKEEASIGDAKNFELVLTLC